MNSLKKVVGIIVLFIFVYALTFDVYAEESSSYYQNKQNEANKNSQATQQQLNNVEGQIS